jgi:hypothetical protein
VRIASRGTRIPDFVIPDGAAALVSEIIINPEPSGARANGGRNARPYPH